MTEEHVDIYRTFVNSFPTFAKKVKNWMAERKNTITITFNDGCAGTFEYHNPDDYVFKMQAGGK